ncbi:hypothetical protein F4804DRAFT_319634 [Jackrogersella minutella]|nr:hypothetical protein F4804DRAFT_319634 [Jackrogersella minutella]
MENGKPTLHHPQNSQSHLTLWLLEELGIEYNLVLYARVQNRAPPSLHAIHPLGKSPTLITPAGRVLTERSAIALWLISTYDSGARFRVPPPSPDSGDDDAVREEQLMSLGGTTLSPLLMTKLVLALAVTQAPALVRGVPALVRRAVDRAFLDAETAAVFAHLDAQLGGGRAWFLGTEEPTRADFSLMWYVDWAVQWKWLDLEKYPRLKAFHGRCTARPAWGRALEKGNGYNLVFW